MLQVTALLQRPKEDGALERGWLVIVPTSLLILTHWQKEAERCAPRLGVEVFLAQNASCPGRRPSSSPRATQTMRRPASSSE